MGFLHHTFSEVYARRNNWLTEVDVRVKLLYIVLLLAINLLAKNIFIPLLFLSVSFILLLSVKNPFYGDTPEHVITIVICSLHLAYQRSARGRKGMAIPLNCGI